MARARWSATNIIAAALALAWAAAWAVGRSSEAMFALGFIPARLSGAAVPWPALLAELTPLSTTLVHAGWPQLLFNVLALVWIGNEVERILGRWSLVFLFIVGAIASALALWAADPQNLVPMLGSGGAISAIVGAYALSLGGAKMFTRSARLNRWLNVAWVALAWVVLQMLVGLTAGGQGVLFGAPASAGGFLLGMILQRPLLLWRYRKA